MTQEQSSIPHYTMVLAIQKTQVGWAATPPVERVKLFLTRQASI